MNSKETSQIFVSIPRDWEVESANQRLPSRNVPFCCSFKTCPPYLFFRWQPHTRSSLSPGTDTEQAFIDTASEGAGGTSVTLKTRANPRTKPVTGVSRCWSKMMSYFSIICLLSYRRSIFCVSVVWSLSAALWLLIPPDLLILKLK